MVPHTAAKHLLLKRYLDAWFPILGTFHTRINYIDGFAGPGEYEGGEDGSPILAIEAAKSHVERGSLAPNVTINFTFVEAVPGYATHLQQRLSRLSCPGQFKISVVPGEFASVIGGILDKLEKGNKILAPTFAFVDPFGFSGIPFDLMARILTNPKCEVFVNVMIEFINRFLDHPNDKVLAHFPNTFGTCEVMQIPSQQGDRIAALLALYRRQLKSKARFVGRFDMHGQRDQKTYSLFFASNSPRGFEKMKESMWSVDKADGGKFSDFEPGAAAQLGLLSFQPLWEDLSSHYRCQQVPMSEIERFVIEETDYLPKHARTILNDQEEKGGISVVTVPDYKRRKGTFKTDKVSIHFTSFPPSLL
jgi:three-Cys-motif partner protein